MDFFFRPPFNADFHDWTSALAPRSCIVVNWLADLGALPEPSEPVRSVRGVLRSVSTLLNRGPAIVMKR